ncbi:MAG: dihydroneopterin aldolase [Sphaerobacter sp.]|nr:dihydroneopterin aldolase [Sphaerobacter sp.]
MTGDRIILEGMVFYGYHGVHPEERALGQRFVVDLEVACDLRPAGSTDELDRTISYSELYQIARRVVEGTPRALIEAVAESIADAVLAASPAIEEVTVTVWKPEAPIKGILRRAGVRIRRARAAGS